MVTDEELSEIKSLVRANEIRFDEIAEVKSLVVANKIKLELINIGSVSSNPDDDSYTLKINTREWHKIFGTDRFKELGGVKIK